MTEMIVGLNLFYFGGMLTSVCTRIDINSTSKTVLNNIWLERADEYKCPSNDGFV